MRLFYAPAITLSLASCAGKMTGIFIIFFLVSTSSHAQIYKWTDANGRTHYSETKEHASTSKTDELKIRSQPTSTKSGNASSEYWQEQERQLKQRQVENSIKKASEPSPTVPRPKSLSGGRSDDTSLSKCNLARDVINGSVRHADGSPTDRYDREVAENNMRTFCH